MYALGGVQGARAADQCQLNTPQRHHHELQYNNNNAMLIFPLSKGIAQFGQ
jgi:hypothetical protein